MLFDLVVASVLRLSLFIMWILKCWIFVYNWIVSFKQSYFIYEITYYYLGEERRGGRFNRERGERGEKGEGGFERRRRNDDDVNNNNEVGENGEKPREFYIPPEPSNDETEIFSSGITSGINFSKYDNIPVKVTIILSNQKTCEN